MIRIRSVKPLKDFYLELELTNGDKKTVDIKSFLRGPIFTDIQKDLLLFRTVHVDTDLGTIVWDNGADIDPDVLIHERTPAWKEEPLLQVKEPRKNYKPNKKKK